MNEMTEHLGYQEIIVPAIVGFIASVAAAIFIKQFLKLRTIRINRKIEDLEKEEQYIGALAKGNVKLIRSSFFILFTILALVCFGVVVLMLCFAIFQTNLNIFVRCGFLISAYFFILAAIFCLMHATTIAKLSNISKSKSEITNAKSALEEKL